MGSRRSPLSARLPASQLAFAHPSGELRLGRLCPPDSSERTDRRGLSAGATPKALRRRTTSQPQSPSPLLRTQVRGDSLQASSACSRSSPRRRQAPLGAEDEFVEAVRLVTRGTCLIGNWTGGRQEATLKRVNTCAITAVTVQRRSSNRPLTSVFAGLRALDPVPLSSRHRPRDDDGRRQFVPDR